ncbi:MarR family winged helix-turn-helix transcriptional regulator [Falsarthrobacter nasiphocae]|uniref:DNA-binding MarR family transcriptional regulator n=1 Tax=Falsarthrobacter nasiphocae TaxID=189863 RepID=A0AAE3YGN7_9MICC|nr:MarR family transcriptional regulator [Falsarthrobacter nasiphocae]MDR6891844.1 DNA-binding MarR family transcriptional regulator [Falsarthrobacter nasiphocae]
MAEATSRHAHLGQIFTELRIFVARLRREWNDRSPDITFAESVLLNAVRRAEGATAAGIASEIGIDKSTVSRQIAAVERRGLLTRQSIEGERRAQLLTLTPEGMRILDTVDEMRLAAIADRLKTWTDEEVATFERLLSRFNEGR